MVFHGASGGFALGFFDAVVGHCRGGREDGAGLVGRLWEGLRGVQLRSVIIAVSVEEGRRRESFGTGWLVVGGVTEGARRSFLNQHGEFFAIYPHERQEARVMLGWTCWGALLLWTEYLKGFNGLKVDDVGSFYGCYTSIADCLMCFRMRPLLFVDDFKLAAVHPRFVLWRQEGRVARVLHRPAVSLAVPEFAMTTASLFCLEYNLVSCTSARGTVWNFCHDWHHASTPPRAYV